MQNKKTLVFVALFLIIALGLFLRIYNIDNTPPGVYLDEAVNGMDAINANNSGNYQLFYTSNQGREGLFMNLIAMCFKFLGISILTLKLPAIIYSTLVIWGTYLLTKELFRKDRMALIAAFLVAVAYWSINFGRISFRANMLPFVLVFAFYFIFKGLRTRKLTDFALGGAFFGLGLHTYIAFRLAPAILIIVLLYFVLSRKNFLKEYWQGIVTFAFLTLLVAAPMLYFFYTHPADFSSRTGNVSVFSAEVNKGNLIGTFFRSFGLSLAKYNFWGDQNWRHNYPPYPILDLLTGIAFLFGFIFCIIQTIRLLYFRIFKKIQNADMDIYVFMLVWFFIMLAPEFLTAEGNPHSLRSIGTLPVVFIFSSLTFEYVFFKTEKYSYMGRKVMQGILILMLLSIGIFNSVKYFYFWAQKPVVAQSFNRNLTNISRYIKTLPENEYIYVITGNNHLEKLPIWIFNSTRKNTWYLFNYQTNQVQPGDNLFIVLLTEHYDDSIAALSSRYPDLKIEKVEDNLESVYYILK